jgi:heat-inducible transcriptional repressor
MNSRQEQLLKLVIESHVETAEPVGSKFLVSEGRLDWSEATVRNELRELEEEGYLTHPHTSAGRMPTEKGYRFYLQSLDLNKGTIGKKVSEQIEGVKEVKGDDETKGKTLAKTLAEVSHQTIIVAFSPEKIYYTGITNLFQQPEFSELNLVVNLSNVFDRCEECVEDFYDEVINEPKYFIGNDQPFGSMLSVLAARWPKTEKGLVALLGPMRMDYLTNYALLKKALEVI